MEPNTTQRMPPMSSLLWLKRSRNTPTGRSRANCAKLKHEMISAIPVTDKRKSDLRSGNIGVTTLPLGVMRNIMTARIQTSLWRL